MRTCSPFRELQIKPPEPGGQGRNLRGASRSDSSGAVCGTDREPPGLPCGLSFLMSRWWSGTCHKHRALAGLLVMGEAAHLWGGGSGGPPPSTLFGSEPKVALKNKPDLNKIITNTNSTTKLE